jgi:hypothetical protein
MSDTGDLGGFQVTSAQLLEGRLLLGCAQGAIHTVNLQTCEVQRSSKMCDHDDAVTAIGPSSELQHFVTSSRDCIIKV